MSKSNINVSLGGSPIFLVFLVLKLTETVDWSWWIVTCPLWLPFAMFFGFLATIAVLGFIGVCIMTALEAYARR